VQIVGREAASALPEGDHADVAHRLAAEDAARLAEAALAHCVFLGDSLELPERVETLHMRGSAHELGSLTWFDSRGKAEMPFCA
jgi:hypothetical protein